MDKKELYNNKRIAKNSIFLYFRMFLTMAVGLYTSRIVLRVLGTSDFGLYNVIGGILSMFTMFSAALTIGTQRFLSFALGERDIKKLKETFSLALYLHIIVAIFICILLESFGLWFLNTQMNIPDGRENSAFWVYQFTILAFMLSIIQVPFQSSLIAHEHMNMYAYMSIYDVTAKLVVVILLQYVNFDKLILYAALMLIVQVTSIIIYNIYCQRHYDECSFKIKWNMPLAKEFISYSGWNLIGGSQSFFTNEGVNILLNIFCGTIINAARGLAVNVNMYILQFVNNFQVAVNPQIIKLYASKEYDKLYKLVINNCRIAEYLFLIIAIPAFIEIKYILHIWLGDYPAYTPIFVQIIIIQSALTPLNTPVGMMVHAAGKMKWLSISSLGLLVIFPVSYIILKVGCSPVYVFVMSAIIWSWSNITQIYFANKYTGIPYLSILKDVYFNIFIGVLVMFIIPYLVSLKLHDDFLGFIIVSSVSVMTSLAVIYIWGLTTSMRTLVKDKILRRVEK